MQEPLYKYIIANTTFLELSVLYLPVFPVLKKLMQEDHEIETAYII